jgi:hypothetical protein
MPKMAGELECLSMVSAVSHGVKAIWSLCILGRRLTEMRSVNWSIARGSAAKVGGGQAPSWF